MLARFQKFVSGLSDTFWLVPGAMVFGGVLLGLGLVKVDRGDLLSAWSGSGAWLYDGGGTGARTLLGAIVGSTIGVAGTVFSITIAALSLAAGQMGPRLLRNFTKDRINQVALGIFLGTFAYALIVLRSVRTQSEGVFVPHLAMTVAVALAFVCVMTLVLFVAHMSRRINVDTVIELVGQDVTATLKRLTTESTEPDPPNSAFWRNAEVVTDERSGYLTQLDASGLADWARLKDTTIRLLVRPGSHVFPGAPIAVIKPAVDGTGDAIRNATALSGQRIAPTDLEYAVRQLVEVAVRALSSGINDPHTAMTVIDSLGAALCSLVPLHLPKGVYMRDEKVALVVPLPDYDGLVDAMFHTIRQNAVDSPTVLIHLLDMLIAVASCERTPSRLRTLQRHADLVRTDAKRGTFNPSDLKELEQRHRRFNRMKRAGPTVRTVQS